MDSSEDRSRLFQVAGIGYLVFLVVVVVIARLGLLPGFGERIASESLWDHPYRLAMAIVTLVFALDLGIGSAMLGVVRRNWRLGLFTLIGGGVLTGFVLAFAPSLLYANDQYPVTFMWLTLGAPVGFLSWLAVTAFSRVLGNRTAAAI